VKKIIKTSAIIGAIGLSWAAGAIVYMMSSVSYFKNREKNEDKSEGNVKNTNDANRRIVDSNPMRKVERPGTSAPRPIRDPESRQIKSGEQWKSYYFGRDISGVRPTDNPK
jgi:hypothetical protein